MSERSARASVDQRSSRLRRAIPCPLLFKKFFYVERTPLAHIKRTGAFVDFLPEPLKLLNMREQLSADLLLLGVRQGGDLRQRFLQYLLHSMIPCLSSP